MATPYCVQLVIVSGHTSEAILQLTRSSKIQPLVFHVEVLGEVVLMCVVEQIMLVKKLIFSNLYYKYTPTVLHCT